MSKQCFYIAGKKVAAVCQEVHDSEMRGIRAARKISRRIGGSRSILVSSQGFYGGTRLTGFSFKDPEKADMKLLKKVKYLSNGFIPRMSTKEGKALDAELDVIEKKRITRVGLFKATEIPVAAFRTPMDMQQLDDKWVLIVDGGKKPKGCRRISDIKYEKMLAESRSKKGGV